MGDIPDDVRPGDALEPYHVNAVYHELRRWRKFKGAYPVVVDGAEGDDAPLAWFDASNDSFFIQLAGAYVAGPPAGYPWAEVLIGANRSVQTTGIGGNAAVGDLAVERQTGDTTLTPDGTVYEARRSPGGGLSFDGKN